MSPASELDKELAPYLDAEHVITNPVSTLSALFFFYGIYSVVFGLSIHVLFRQNSSAHKLYKACTLALYILGTIYTVVLTWGLCRQTLLVFDAATTKHYTPFLRYGQGDDAKTAWAVLQEILSNLMNSIADIMLVHRCYIIFNSNKFILYPLASVAFILNGIDLGCIFASIVAEGSSSRPFNLSVAEKLTAIDEGVIICIVIFQVLLTLLTGGRVWWITSEIRKAEARSVHKFNVIVAVIIESSLLYAGFLLTSTILIDSVWVHNPTGTVPFDPDVVSILTSALAPTMVIAWIAYGKSVDTVQQELSTFCVADNQAGQHRSNVTQQVTMDLQTPSQHIVGSWQEGGDLRAIQMTDKSGKV